MREHFLWVEKYRPKTIAETILPDRLKTYFQSLVNKGEMQNMLLVGGPGTGKTTVARAMCEELGNDYIVINASENGGIDTLRTTIRSFASSVSLNGKIKVVILDEADFLNCFDGNQEVIISSEDGIHLPRRLEDLENERVKMPCYNFETGQIEETEGHVFCSGYSEVFEVEFEDGSTMLCTKDHEFFDEYGESKTITDLSLFSINENETN